MADSPWNKRFLTKQKLPAASNQPAQLPTAATPIQVTLSGTTLSFENGQWKPTDISAISLEAGEELKKLREENQDLKERNNMLEFKLELLIDMLAIRDADIEVLKSNEDKLQEKLRKLSSRNIESKKN